MLLLGISCLKEQLVTVLWLVVKLLAAPIGDEAAACNDVATWNDATVNAC